MFEGHLGCGAGPFSRVRAQSASSGPVSKRMSMAQGNGRLGAAAHKLSSRIANGSGCAGMAETTQHWGWCRRRQYERDRRGRTRVRPRSLACRPRSGLPGPSGCAAGPEAPPASTASEPAQGGCRRWGGHSAASSTAEPGGPSSSAEDKEAAAAFKASADGRRWRRPASKGRPPPTPAAVGVLPRKTV